MTRKASKIAARKTEAQRIADLEGKIARLKTQQQIRELRATLKKK